MKYHEQLKHPLWQKKRLEVLGLSGFECQNCGASDKELHVHHPFYKRGAMIWDYRPDELQCLCAKCHKDIHAVDEHIRLRISQLDLSSKEILAGFVGGMLGVGCDMHKESPAHGYEYMLGLTIWGKANPYTVSDDEVTATISGCNI